jgi:DNA-binding sugar fermentation-stimulating protein
VCREFKLGNCRFDFVAHHEDGSITIVEVKNVRHTDG